MPKHTPGPWKTGTYGREHQIYAKGIKIEIVTCHYGIPNVDHKNAEANARLIASAPELLEALKDIKNRAIRIKEAKETIFIEATFIERICNQAIAKAEEKE